VRGLSTKISKLDESETDSSDTGNSQEEISRNSDKKKAVKGLSQKDRHLKKVKQIPKISNQKHRETVKRKQ